LLSGHYEDTFPCSQIIFESFYGIQEVTASILKEFE